MKLPKYVLLSTAAVAVAGMVGLSYSQSDGYTAPATSSSNNASSSAPNSASNTTPPTSQESANQQLAEQNSKTMPNNSGAPASSDSDNMGGEKVARADHN